MQDGQPSSRARVGSHLETGLGPPGEEASLLSAPSGWQGQPHFISWPPCLLLHFRLWPWVPRDHHLQAPALKLGALGLPPATVSCPPHPAHSTSQVVNELILPLSSPPAKRACVPSRGRCDCASWMRCLPLSSCRSSGDVFWFSSRGGLPLETFLVVPARSGCSWQCMCGGQQAVTPWMLQGKEQAQGVSASHATARVSSESRALRPPSMAWCAPTDILFSSDPAECHQAQPRSAFPPPLKHAELLWPSWGCPGPLCPYTGRPTQPPAVPLCTGNP